MKRDGPSSKQRTVADNGEKSVGTSRQLTKAFTANKHLHTVPTPLASLVYTCCCLLESGTPMYVPTHLSQCCPDYNKSEEGSFIHECG